MVPIVIQDLTGVALHAAMTGLAARQRVTADNIANIQTPGFLAKRVLFEDALASAVSSGSTASTATVGPDVATSLEPTRMDGNNVNLDHETLTNVDTNLRFQLVSQAYSARAALLRSAMRTAG